MTTSTRWWFGAFVVAVFLAGTSVGVIVDRLWLLRGGPFGTPAVSGAADLGARRLDVNWVSDLNLLRLRDHLGLTTAQAEAVRPLLEAWAARIVRLQITTREQLQAEAVRLEGELATVLTPEQQAALSTARNILALPPPGRGGRFEGPRRGGPGRGGPGFGPGGPTGRGRE